jgi:hypothetical protein
MSKYRKLINNAKQDDYINDNMANKEYHAMTKLIVKSITHYIQKTPHIYKHYNFYFIHQKHTLSTILYELVEHIKYCKPLRSSKILPKSTIHYHKKNMIKYSILKNTYCELLNAYLIKTPGHKLQCRYVDTTLIKNRCGKDKVGYSGKHKTKGTKLELITDVNGIVLKYTIEAGNMHDKKICFDHFDDPYLSDICYNYGKYYVADSAYDSKDVKEKICDMKLIPLIEYNKRKTKDENVIRQHIFNKEHKIIYKTRFSIENTNGLVKTCKRTQIRYDRNIEYFDVSLLYSFIERILCYMFNNE